MWVLVGIGVGAAFVLLLVLISVLCLLAFRRRRRRQRPTNHAQQLPTTAPPKSPANVKAPKNIQEVPSHAAADAAAPAKAPLAQVLQLPTPQVSEQIVTGKEHRITNPEQRQQHPSQRRDGPPHGSDESRGGRGGAAGHAPPAVPEVSHLGWGHWYTLKELETATGMFADENVIGEGGYGIVYHGVLENGTHVAVKNLLNNRYRTTYQYYQ